MILKYKLIKIKHRYDLKWKISIGKNEAHKLVDNFTAKYYMMDRTIHKKKYLPSDDGSSNCTHILMEMNEKQDYHY